MNAQRAIRGITTGERPPTRLDSLAAYDDPVYRAERREAVYREFRAAGVVDERGYLIFTEPCPADA